MKTNPLKELHLAAGAPLIPWEGGELPARFDDPAAELEALQTGCALVDLSPSAVLQLQGSDTRRYGNSQLSNNIKDMAPGHGNHSVITDRKGRLQGMLDGYLIDNDTLLVITVGSQAEEMMERLDMFIIMDDVELTDESAHWTLLSLQGPQAERVLLKMGLAAPEGVHAQAGTLRVMRCDRFGQGGFDLLVPVAEAESWWRAALSAGATPAGVNACEVARINYGLARWPVDMGARAFIHELGLRNRVCSFNKGCYIGQEVINRMDTMGKVNKRLTRVQVPKDAPAGAVAWLGDTKVGDLRSVAAVGGQGVGLAMLRSAAWEPGSQLELRSDGQQWAAQVQGPAQV